MQVKKSNILIFSIRFNVRRKNPAPKRAGEISEFDKVVKLRGQNPLALVTDMRVDISGIQHPKRSH